MWLSDRRAFLLLAAASLTACQFTPVYGPESQPRRIQGQIFVNEISGLNGFNMREAIERRLGVAPEGAPFVLTVTLDIASHSVGVSTTNAITRTQYAGTANYVLASADGTVLTSGSETNLTAYDATGSSLANSAAAADAQLRLVEALADQVVTSLMATADRWAR